MQLQQNTWNNKKLADVLRTNGVAVMPTDTLYGTVGRAQDIFVVNRIYALKKRVSQKPCIILIGDIDELEKFSIILSEEQKNKLKEYWPGTVSVIFDCFDDSLEYLHRGTKTLAFRLPAPKSLQDLLSKVGPLIAPSANPEGLPPAKNISEAQKYFGDSIDFYSDGGQIDSRHSKLIRLHKDGTINILRE